MLKLKNRRKSTLAIFSLCLLALTGCQNKSSIAESEESITEETIDESFLLSLSEEDLELDCDIRDEYISIKDYNHGHSVAPENMYDDINEALNSSEIDSLMLAELGKSCDVSKIDISNIKNLWVTLPREDFNYQPLYNQTHNLVNIKISEKSNVEELKNFLNNINYESTVIDLNVSALENPQQEKEILDVLNEKKGILSLYLHTSSCEKFDFNNLYAKDLNVSCDVSDLLLNFEINLNRNIKVFTIMPVYDEDFDSDVALGKLKINSSNPNLEINYFLWKDKDECFKAKINKGTSFEIETNAVFHIMGVDIKSLTDEEFAVFDDIMNVYIDNWENRDIFFFYSKDYISLEEAIKSYRLLTQEKGRVLSPN